ncbi:LysE family translocator [Amycolatopsis viridis]|uniref:Threonine/homoserine/homoserine lactone efflux protein n=1 Tax=Amycolatopsis viridis TaxID=185678 RepID=A0ABX0SMQ8_9PSEU|nr:LysE family translocator [Amycolatopsis viridis]NIH78252.1 threonine/homoserine/homoserine lactone efflux protein [Amycolatopsis viridis]
MPNVLAFVPAAFLIALVPGPATLMLVKQSARGSRRNSLATIAGIEAGVLVWGLAAVFGISALLVASETAYTVLRIAGAVYLVFLGARMLLRRHGPVDEPRPGAGFRAGFLINVTNPKAGVFAISFLPQFVPAHAAGPLPLLLLVLVWMLTDTVWYTALALALTRVGRWLRTATVRQRLEKSSGGVFVAFGVAMAVAVES